jgi:hypothetical protein
MKRLKNKKRVEEKNKGVKRRKKRREGTRDLIQKN